LTHHRRKQIGLRVRRIHGHVHAITEMIDEGRSYADVVHQISAVRSALDGVIQVIVDDLVEESITKLERKEPLDDTLHELQAVVGKLR
jgi:DNA-binding FrmR family transcriptional regulator